MPNINAGIIELITFLKISGLTRYHAPGLGRPNSVERLSELVYHRRWRVVVRKLVPGEPTPERARATGARREQG
jgi:hypothetical protein